MPAVLHPFANRSAHPARGRSYRCTAFLVRLGLIALVASGAPAAQAGDLTRFAELPPAPAKPRTLHRAGPIKVNGLEQRIPGAPSNLRVLGRVVNESVEDGAMGPRYNYDVELRFTNYGSHAVSFTLPPGQATFLDQRITIDQCINTDTIGYPQDPRKRNHVILARGESVTLVERIQNFASVCQDIRVRPTHVKLHYGAYVDECLRDFPGTLKSARQKQAAGDFEGALSTLVGGHQAHGCSGRVGRRSELREQAEALFIELKQQREGAAEDARAAKARRDEALRYIQRGDDKMAREDITGAIRDYERALEIDPDTAAQSRLQRAESALAARRQAEARKREEMEQKRADDVRKATLDRHLTRFDEAMAAGDLDAARTALSAAESAGLSASEASTRRTAIRTRAAELQRAAADPGTEARPGGSRDATATPGGGDAGASGPASGPEGQEWQRLVLAARGAYKRGDFTGAITLYNQALDAGGDVGLINHELRQAENLARQKAQQERMVAEQQRMAAHYEQQQREAEERRRVQQEQRLATQKRQAEAEAARIMAEYERNIAKINAVEEFVTGRILSYANNTELRNLARAARSLDTSLDDPAALLADYESKVATLADYAQTKQQEFAVAMDELREVTQQLLAEAEAEAQAAGQLAVIAFQATGHIAIKAQEQKQSRILREELQAAFNEMKADLIRDNQKGLRTAQVNEAKSMAFAVEEWANGVANYYQCNIDQINSRFSYDHAGWADPDCTPPDSAPDVPPVSTPAEAVRLGEQKLARARQGGPVADLWLETASVLADGAAELDRDHAPAWALKADITPDTIDKLAWYRRARDLNDNSGWDYAYGHAQGTFSAAFFTAIKEQKTAYIERSSTAGVHWLAEGPNGESPILVALDANDSATVATTFRVFDHDPVVEGGPLLHLAASRDLSGAVSGLLESEVPNAWEDEDGKTAYYIAISTGSEAAAQVLAAEEPPDHLALMRLALTLAEVQTADKLGQIGMDQAIKADDLAAAGRLLRTNARLITLPRDLQDGYASWAVRNGASEWLQLFLRNGAFVDDTDLEGNPLLYLSLESEQFEVAEYLIEHGAAVDSQTTQTGESAMHAAVRLGTPWVDRLLGEQAIPDLADKAGRTPLHNAVELDSIEIIQRLIAAQADTSLQDGEGATPAMLAAKRRDSEMLDLLLPVTVAIDVQDDRGLTLVHHVVAQKLMPTLSALIERDARLDLADAVGDTPMHVALTECSDGAARALREAGAPLKPGNALGERPIHLAARCGDDEIVQASLQERIHVDTPTGVGRTPLHEAAAAGQSELAQMLLENKADKWLRDEDGAKPTKLARKGGHRGTRQVISRYKPPKEERLSPVRRVLLQVGLVRTFASEAELVEADAPVDAGAPVDTMEATEPAGADSAPPPAAEPQGDPPADWLDAAPADGADATTEE